MGATFLLAYVANSYGFRYVLSVVSSSICWIKRQTSSVEAGFKTPYIRRRGKTRQVQSKNKKSKNKQINKSVLRQGIIVETRQMYQQMSCFLHV